MPSARHRAAFILIATLALPRNPASAELPGELDPTFNAGQPQLLDIARTVPRTTYFQAVTFDAQGRVVVAGNSIDEAGRYAVALVRLAADGSLDTSFGSNGSTVVQLGLGTGAYAPTSRARVIGPRPDGAGWLIAGLATASDARGAALVGAFDPNGILDIGYGNGGSVRPQPAGPTETTNADGGAVGTDGATYVASTVDGVQRKLAVSKVLVNGALATTFGNVPAQGSYVGSFSEFPTDTGSYGAGILLTASGILVVGTTLDPTASQELLVLRLTASGFLDTAFGGGTGFFRHQVGDPAAPSPYSQGHAIARGPDGEIYAGGLATDGDGRSAIAVTRLTPGGLLDGSFGSGGTRRVQTATTPNPFQSIREVLVQPDGKVLVLAGTNEPDSIVLRLDVDGDLDPSFGTSGIVRLHYGSQTFVGGGALSPDAQSVMIVGLTTMESIDRGFIAKMLLVPFTPTTTTTTLPGGGCASAPSLAGARCRIGGLVTSIDGLVPSGKLRSRLDRTLGRADSALASAESASGKSLRRKLKRGLAQMRRLGRQLGSKAAQRAIGIDQRAAFGGQVDALVSELSALVGALP